MVIRERRKRIYRKRIPYGMQNFEDVIKEDCFYVEKGDSYNLNYQGIVGIYRYGCSRNPPLLKIYAKEDFFYFATNIT